MLRAGRARRLIVLAAALLGCAATARLGVWQLDRAAQKRELQATLEARSAAPPLAQAQLADRAAAAAGQYQRRIRLRGSWIGSATVFLDNRQLHGRPGFFVLTPLRLADAADAVPAPVVWVQRGWVARDNDERSRLPRLPTPAGIVELDGRVAPAPARLFQFATDSGGPIRQNLDLDASARELGVPVLPLMVVQTQAASSGPDGLSRDWPAPALDLQKHYGYAFQWFALSALIAGLYAWYQLIRPRRAARETS